MKKNVHRNISVHLCYSKQSLTDSVSLQAAEDFLKQIIAGMTPEEEQYLKQLLAEAAPASGPLRVVVHNILDEPVPQEVKERFPQPLRQQPFQPKAPPRRRGEKRGRKRQEQEILRLYDLLHPEFDEELHEKEENGRRTTFWHIKRELGKDLMSNFMAKIRDKVTTFFYARYAYGYWLRNIVHGTDIVYYKNIGSPWFERHSEAEEWLRGRENVRLDPDNVKRPDTKWAFVGFKSVDVKVVRDRQPLLGEGFLPDWLGNLAHGRSMLTLNTYQDNLCLWRCIAVHQGANPQ